MTEHDGCRDCAFESFEKGDYPCRECRGTVSPSRDEYKTRPDFWEPKTTEDKPDMVNHPSHYETGKFECIDVMIETQGEEAVKEYCLCAAFKYLYRHKRKNGFEDIKKARWYLDKYIELEGDST